MTAKLSAEELEPPKSWRCFHCDEVFTDYAAARQHFGCDESAMPECVYRSYEAMRRDYRDARQERMVAEAQRDAAQAQVREVEWLPIATAPKDGTTVLLGASGLVEVGYWQDFHKAETECGVPVECDVDEGWYGSCDFWPSGKQPTHWQPLPPPPARLEQERTA